MFPVAGATFLPLISCNGLLMKCISPRRSLSLQLTALLILLLVGAVSLPGCGGCQKETAAQKKKRVDDEKKKEEDRKRKKKAEQPKPNFDPIISQILPNTVTTNPPAKDKDKDKEAEKEKAKEEKQTTLEYAYVKPGHFVTVMQTLKANNFDYPGMLRTYPTDANNNPLDVYKTNYRVSMFRPASLPKGQGKFIESTFFLPQRDNFTSQGRYNMRVELLSSRGGSMATQDSAMGTSMRDHEYFIVVLAANAEPYIGLKDPKMHSVVVSESEISRDGSLRFYHVVLPKIERRVPLPSTSFAWTTIAYIIWDDLDPAILTQDQQNAMLDWIHWGGQLIISGPNSLDKLKGSFLAPYLPAESGQALKLDQTSFDELNTNWSLPSIGNDKKKPMTAAERSIKFVGNKPMLGVELLKHPLGDFLEGTGKLVVERRVGGGRVAATAFPLTDIRIRLWPNFDGFLNGCLLRRPAREFHRNDLVELRMNWSAPDLANYVRDPRMACTLRYFSRDIGFPTGLDRPAGVSRTATIAQQETAPPRARFPGYMDVPLEAPLENTVDKQPKVDDWHFAGYRADNESGVGGWSDLTPVSAAARESLGEAGKIAIPKADFVLKVLAIYLLVLVPLNWLFFWLIGRVEWAWAAAPIIAIIAAVCVIRLAQLNIGFVRSRTEIAVLETQADYPRGHVTRYTRLYTSLSTGYDLSFDDPSAVALPFVTNVNFVRLPTESAKYVEFRQDKNTTLSGVQVNSNSTEGVHSEHMVPLGKHANKPGGIRLTGNAQQGQSVRNDTPFTLRDVGVLRKVDGVIQVAYVAEVQPGTAVPLAYVPSPNNESWVANWDQSLVMSAKVQAQEEDKGAVRLYRLVELAAKQLKLASGDVRLIAWTDDAVPGMNVYPAPAQNNTRTLILSHLARAKIPAASCDKNVAEDYVLPELDEEMKPEEPPAGTGAQRNSMRPGPRGSGVFGVLDFPLDTIIDAKDSRPLPWWPALAARR